MIKELYECSGCSTNVDLSSIGVMTKEGKLFCVECTRKKMQYLKRICLVYLRKYQMRPTKNDLLKMAKAVFL